MHTIHEGKESMHQVLLYRSNGKPVMMCLWVFALSAQVMRGLPLSLVFFANLTATSLKRVKQITLGRFLGAGAYGSVHVGTLHPNHVIHRLERSILTLLHLPHAKC